MILLDQTGWICSAPEPLAEDKLRLESDLRLNRCPKIFKEILYEEKLPRQKKNSRLDL